MLFRNCGVRYEDSNLKFPSDLCWSHTWFGGRNRYAISDEVRAAKPSFTHAEMKYPGLMLRVEAQKLSEASDGS
jgi:hypothetical protein